MLEEFEEEEIKLDIAEHVYYLRDATGLTQEEFGELVGIDPVIIDDLEESDYEGDSLAVLAHIEKSPSADTLKHPLNLQRPSIRMHYSPQTITGLKLRLFRYHIGRKTTTTNNKGLETKTPARETVSP